MNNYICINGAHVEVKLTGAIGHVVARSDTLNGGNYYKVAHINAAGDRVTPWLAEHEIKQLEPGDTRKPPGLPYVNTTPPVVDPPGGGGEGPGEG